jgi:glycosyltransferase involved in cell wall biosynthesis
MPSVPISVVIPAYNAEDFLEEAIQSVHAQTLQPAEIIVIADDCTDRTPQIATDLGAIVLEQKRRNMAAGLNLGVKASSQPWIALLDADDIWHERKLALQWKAIQNWPAAALISCDRSTLVDKEVAPPSRRYMRERWMALESLTVKDGCYYLEIVDGDFLARVSIGTPTVILRRDVFSTVGLFDESLLFGQTLEFFARVVARYPLAFVEQPLVYERRHERNHTNNLQGYWTAYISIIDRMLKNPSLYPKGAGQAYRERLKEQFVHFERAIARGRFKIGLKSDTKKAGIVSATEE